MPLIFNYLYFILTFSKAGSIIRLLFIYLRKSKWFEIKNKSTKENWTKKTKCYQLIKRKRTHLLKSKTVLVMWWSQIAIYGIQESLKPWSSLLNSIETVYCARSLSILVLICGKLVLADEAKRSTCSPFLLTKNLTKFHLMLSPPVLPFRNSYKGSAFDPFTLIFWKTSPTSASRSFKWHTIASPSFCGIWLPNWLHGNDRILKAEKCQCEKL